VSGFCARHLDVSHPDVSPQNHLRQLRRKELFVTCSHSNRLRSRRRRYVGFQTKTFPRFRVMVLVLPSGRQEVSRVIFTSPLALITD